MKEFTLEVVAFADLLPHPRNYREHPEDQIVHLMESIQEHGLYRNIVIARDNTILAGHGIWIAAMRLGIERGPVYRLALDAMEPRALKVLTGDNEIAHLGERNDRILSEILKLIKEEDEAGLLGTGYTDQMLANLVFVSRPASEIKDFDAAAEWVGMPEYEEGESTIKLILSFRSPEDREELMSQIGVSKMSGNQNTWMAWWPPRQRDDLSSIKFVESGVPL